MGLQKIYEDMVKKEKESKKADPSLIDEMLQRIENLETKIKQLTEEKE